MAHITAALVKELREKTGVGMMDCKKALTETDGEIEASIDWLRKKGLSAAAKKAGRVAAEGLVGVASGNGAAALVEINSETDFVARNETFQSTVQEVAGIALTNRGDVAALGASDYPGSGRTVAEELTHLVATIGENINLRRSAVLAVDEGIVASYMHAATTAGLGRIGVIVGMKSSGDKAKLEVLGRQVAMHIAAANPQAVSPDDLDPQMLERERSVLIEQAKASGKPDNIIEKMVEGRIRKFYEEVALLHQTWVMDGESKVSNILAASEADIGSTVSISGFVRFALGEGVERNESDFAAEVAQTLKS